MPQMAPLPWLLLMLMFIISLTIFITIVYFISNTSSPTFSLYHTPSNKNWMW